MNSYSYYEQCHYDDLISFIEDLNLNYGKDAIDIILSYHINLISDIAEYRLYLKEIDDNED